MVSDGNFKVNLNSYFRFLNIPVYFQVRSVSKRRIQDFYPKILTLGLDHHLTDKLILYLS
jgi:hypothetical protein